jgi:hypothetical protein
MIGIFKRATQAAEPQSPLKTKLDFIIVGAEKAGTTYLSRCLSQSPEIFIPQHEIRHFRDPFYPNQELFDDLFAPYAGRTRGLKHPSYLGRPEVPERIFRHNPDLKLIFLLRDPVKRAISSYLHYVRHGQIPLLHPNIGLLNLVQSQSDNDAPKYRDIREFGLYFKYLSLYLKYFDRKSMLILEYEDCFTNDPECTAVSDFLKVGRLPSVPPKRLNEGKYDWNQCVVEFCKSLMSRQYDSALNIMGVQNHPYLASFEAQLPEFRAGLAAHPIDIETPVMEALRAFYDDDIGNLKESGIFVPKNW